VHECETAYTELSSEVFGKEQSGKKFRYDVMTLEKNIEKVLAKAEATRETKLLDETAGEHCRTFVIAKRYLALNSPAVLLRSYKLDGTEIQCTILEAARATSAAPTYFPEMKIGRDYYVDGGITSNNPAGEAVYEAGRIWENRNIGCLVSIGTGLMEPISGATRTKEQFGNRFGGIIKGMAPLTAEKLSVAQYCTEVTTSCQAVHHELVQNKAVLKVVKGGRPRYYRFNVTAGMSDIGLQEADKMDKISQVTDAYLSEPERRELISDCVELLYCDEAIRGAAG
jgi:Patatin-like phospholipase